MRSLLVVSLICEMVEKPHFSAFGPQPCISSIALTGAWIPLWSQPVGLPPHDFERMNVYVYMRALWNF